MITLQSVDVLKSSSHFIALSSRYLNLARTSPKMVAYHHVTPA